MQPTHRAGHVAVIALSCAFVLPACGKKALTTDAGESDAAMVDAGVDAATLEEQDALIAPPYVVVGDAFRLVGESDFHCVGHGESDPMGIVAFIDGELVSPGFPTPIRSYYARFRALAKGKTTLGIVCSGERIIKERAITVLDASDAEPSVTIEGGDKYDLDGLHGLERGRASAVACFATELARDPKVRGDVRIPFEVDTTGVRSVPADQKSTSYGISQTMDECVRHAISKAEQAEPPSKSPPKTNPYWSVLSLRFAMAPKTADPKACAHFADRLKACSGYADTNDHAAAGDRIVTWQKVVTTDEGRHALAIQCAALTDELERDCADGMRRAAERACKEVGGSCVLRPGTQGSCVLAPPTACSSPPCLRCVAKP